MTLQEKLDVVKAQFKQAAPSDIISMIERSTEDLIASGQAQHALKAREKAPEFILPDTDGNNIALRDLLNKGPVVLTFYRGHWCSYCNLELQSFEAVYRSIRDRGANLVAVSMQRPAESLKSQHDNALSFPILHDKNGQLARKFGVRWTLQPYLVKAFKMFNIDLPMIHNDDGWKLPMSARYIIEPDRTIAYAEVNADYTRRLDPTDIFPILDRISRAAA